MLKIRLTRTGKKKQPNYRIVVQEHTAPIQGKFVEILGNYNPFTKKITIDEKITTEWLKKGAKPSNTVAKLLIKSGLKHDSIVVKKFKAKSKTEVEKEKTEKEAEKKEATAEKEAKKVEFEKEVEEKKEAEQVKEENTESDSTPNDSDQTPVTATEQK
jgi:small subunit ribosomal protein S16